MPIDRVTLRDRAFLLGVWTVALAVNVTKAVHVDDAAHLLIAEHIARDPLHPMSGAILWGEHTAPIHTLSQPHLFFYLLALARLGTGGSLLGPHLLVAAFTALGIVAFHRLARRAAQPERALAWTALVFIGPGFLPGQNLMTDVPLLALGLVMLCVLCEPESNPKSLRGPLLAGLVVGVACLVKYTALAWLPILVVDAWVRRAPRRLSALVPALVILVGYAAFNVADYDGVHLLERTPGSAGERSLSEGMALTLGRGALFVMTLGAISPHVLLYAERVRTRTWVLVASAIALLTLGAQALALVGPAELRGEPLVLSVLRAVFFVGGLAALRLGFARRSENRLDTLLRAYVIVTGAFVVIAAPFIAVRHVFLLLPALVLLAARSAPPAPSRMLVTAIAVSAMLGVMLAVSDARFATVYREAAARWRDNPVTLDSPDGTPRRHIYFAGHWGWQWYSTQAGLEPYEPGVTRLVRGDLIIRPGLPDPPALSGADLAACPIARVEHIEAGTLDCLRTTTERPGFYSVWQGTPWTLSLAPVERFDVHVCR